MFGPGFISGVASRVSQIRDQEREERMLEERMTRQEDFQREMAGLRHGYSLELNGLRESAAQRKEEQQQQAAITDTYTMLASTGGTPEQVQAVWSNVMGLVDSGQLSMSAGLKYINDLIKGGIDFDRLVFPEGDLPEQVGSADDAMAFPLGISEEVVREGTTPRPRPTDLSMGTQVPSAPASPDVSGGLVRMQPAEPVPGTTEHQAAQNFIQEQSVNQLNIRNRELSNFIRENSGTMTSEAQAVLNRALQDTQQALGSTSEFRGIITSAFAADTREAFQRMHPTLRWDSVFLDNPAFERSAEIQTNIDSVKATLPQGTQIRQVQEDGSVKLEPITDDMRLLYIENLINEPTIPLIAIPIELWTEYHRITSERARQGVRIEREQNTDSGDNRDRQVRRAPSN